MSFHDGILKKILSQIQRNECSLLLSTQFLTSAQYATPLQRFFCVGGGGGGGGVAVEVPIKHL